MLYLQCDGPTAPASCYLYIATKRMSATDWVRSISVEALCVRWRQTLTQQLTIGTQQLIGNVSALISWRVTWHS